MRPSTLSQYEVLAKDSLSQMAYNYFVGGARDEVTLNANRQAWERIWLHYRVLVDVQDRTAETHILGRSTSTPILIAPTAFHGLAHQLGECETAIGAERADSIYIVSTLSNRSLEDVARVSSGRLWFQLYVYRDRQLTLSLIRRAEDAGYEAIVLTVDAAEIGTRERDHRLGFHLPSELTLGNLQGTGKEYMGGVDDGSALSHYVRDQLDASLTWSDLEWLTERTHLPVLVKGIVRADDAGRAMERGAQGVVVSNHGGRQLDTAPPTALVLPSIVEAVGGRGAVLVDGGIRRGTDVIKALALGAHGVLIGRPILWGLAVDGAHGVERVLKILHDELLEGMALCGCPSIDSIDRSLIDPHTPSALITGL
jgi:4-hydroxymandelate oxidase